MIKISKIEDIMKIFLFIICGILVNNILTPLPSWLQELFTKNYLFNFIVLFIFCLIVMQPLNAQNLIIALIISISILSIFIIAHKIQNYIPHKALENPISM